jgi:hypothetical protein
LGKHRYYSVVGGGCVDENPDSINNRPNTGLFYIECRWLQSFYKYNFGNHYPSEFHYICKYTHFNDDSFSQVRAKPFYYLDEYAHDYQHDHAHPSISDLDASAYTSN